jgi:superfamily II DNA helicase RecQ
MQDQAASFQRAGIQADYLCSTRSERERACIFRQLQGACLGLHLLLVTPESFGTEQCALSGVPSPCPLVTMQPYLVP